METKKTDFFGVDKSAFLQEDFIGKLGNIKYLFNMLISFAENQFVRFKRKIGKEQCKMSLICRIPSANKIKQHVS